MNESQAKEFVLESMSVSRADIASAKAFLTDRGGQEITANLIAEWLRSNGIGYPDPVLLRKEDVKEQLRSVARAFSLRIAGYIAVWDLISAGYVYPAGQTEMDTPHVGWTTVLPGSGGSSSGWTFPEIAHPYPTSVFYGSSVKSEGPFTDGDLYLNEIGVSDLHPGIEEALREAARAFRHDLYTAAVAMLGAASEGIWSELGSALVCAAPETAKSKKLERILNDPYYGAAQLINSVTELCTDRAQSGDILKDSQVPVAEFQTAVLWSHSVREARNVLHWGATPAVANTYDKVATLMLTTAQHISTLWRIRRTALDRSR